MTDPTPRPQELTLIEQASKVLMQTFSGYIAGVNTFGDLEDRILDLIEAAHEAQRQTLQDHFCIRCHHRWTVDLTFEYCGDCHREGQELAVRLVQAEQELDRAVKLSQACAATERYGQLYADGQPLVEWKADLARAYAQGRGDTLAQVRQIVNDAPMEY